MPNKLSNAAIEALRSTLLTIEEQSGMMPDDAALVELKRILLGRITELEAAQQSRGAEVEPPGSAVLESSPAGGHAAAALALDLAVSLVAERPAAHPSGPDAAEPQNANQKHGES